MIWFHHDTHLVGAWLLVFHADDASMGLGGSRMHDHTVGAFRASHDCAFFDGLLYMARSYGSVALALSQRLRFPFLLPQ